jgi:hypothetical protein
MPRPLPVLSVEVWQTILRYSISVAEFFNPDAFEGDLKAHGFGDAGRSRVDEAAYWDSEQTRNTLQCVCKTWCEYLRRFEHRYVRMGDITHRKIDERSLKKAIRISFYRDECTCREVCYPSFTPSGIPRGLDRRGAYDKFAQFCCKTIQAFDNLPAEILDMSSLFTGPLWNSGALRILKEVKVIIAWGFYGDTITIPLLSQTPNLKHLRGNVHDDLQHLQFISRTLVTLSLKLGRMDSYQALLLDLPSLLHLRVDLEGSLEPSIFFGRVLVPLFGKVGRQVRSLYLQSRDRHHKMPAEVWEHCSHLEIFHPGTTLEASAPMSHPIHTLSVRPEHMFQTLTLQWYNLSRLILCAQWSGIHDAKRLSEFFTLWTREMQGRGVVFEDCDDITLAAIMRARGLA